MSLLDSIGSADGGASRNYLDGGRTIGRIRAVAFRDATAKLPKSAFRVDVEILASTNPKHAQEIGQTGTVNLSFRYPEQDLARMRRMLSVGGTSKFGKPFSEKEAAEQAKDLVGESQPLVGAVVAIEAIAKPQEKNPQKTFTKYELELPTEADLKAAGLLQ